MMVMPSWTHPPCDEPVVQSTSDELIPAAVQCCSSSVLQRFSVAAVHGWFVVQMEHPNIVRMHEVYEASSSVVISMDILRVTEPSLSSRQTSSRSPRQALVAPDKLS